MKRILLAEDDALVATDLACELESLGMTIAGIASSLEGALESIDGREIDFALLNVGLQDGVSYPAAKRLEALGIPYAFFTSFEKGEIEPEFRDVPRLSKPQAPKAIAEFVVGLVGGSTKAYSREGREKTTAC